MRSASVLQLLRAVALSGQVLIVQWLLSGLLSLDGPAPQIPLLVGSLLVLALLTAVIAVAGAVVAEQQRLLGELTVRTVWERILGVTSSVPLEAFETPAFYDRLQRVETQAVGRPIVVVHSLVGLLGGLTGAVGATLALAAIEPLLLPVVVVGAVPALLAARRASRLEYAFAVAQTPRIRLREYVSHLLTGRSEATEVRAYGLASYLTNRYRQVNERFLLELRAHLRRRARLLAAGGVAGAVALAAAGGLVAWFVTRGVMDVAAAGAAVIGARLLGQQVAGLVASIQAIAESGPFLDDLQDFLQTSPRGPSPAVAAADGPEMGGFDVLDVRDVSYRYPGSERLAVQRVSFRVRRGEIVALVGENGSGKTTLAKVIAGLLPASGGQVCRDGVPLDDRSTQTVRQATAMVFQDFQRFQLSARENVALGDVTRTTTDEAVEAAARKAGAWDSLARLPDGLDTTLSKAFGTVDLSTGTWQRVALARAFFRDAPFMLLDEPAASLDARAEHELFAALRGLAVGRTALFVSHRFATVRDADRILVMHEGRLVEEGSHEQLMSAGGRYAEMFRLQAAAYSDIDGRKTRPSMTARSSSPSAGSLG